MNLKYTVSFILAFSFSIVVSAQQSAIYTNALETYQKALRLYNHQQYLAATTLFAQVKKASKEEQLKGECAYYIANCAVRLNQQNADQLITDFVEDYPTSTKRNTAFVDVADYYFANGKYAHSQKWYSRVDENALAFQDKEQFYFNNGYTAFITKQYKTAKTYLSKVENSKAYGAQAKYYIGYMAYQTDNYSQASNYFKQINDDGKYREKLSYYQADLNFKLGKFEKAIALAKTKLSTSNGVEVSELSKIIGESYFNLERYKEAIPYLEAYKGKRGKWNNTDYYQLGYAHYKEGAYEKAISEFNKIIGGNDSVAQNAYYHLGESYIKLDKKQEALNAFKNASEMAFDVKIQEDAWLNYAKISYEIGNPYQSVPQVLTAYLERYPKTVHKTEMETLLIDSYISSKNYQEAIELLKTKNSLEAKIAYQKVTFFRGLELYNASKYTEAETLFDSSLKVSRDEIFTARAIFWKAETDYNLSNYEDALIGFKQCAQYTTNIRIPESENLAYNLGYTYFKLKNYEQASKAFATFLSQSTADNTRLNDAYLRQGDVYFVSRNYKEAIKAYDNAIQLKAGATEYPFFQKAISIGYAGDTAQKIKALEAFIERYPTSKLRDDAFYELGNSYAKLDESEKAMAAYDALRAGYKMSSFVPKALLRQGLMHYNSNKNEAALEKFKGIAANYPGTPEAVQAVATARLIYIDLGQVGAYAAWVKTLDYVEITDAELDQTTYEAAEKHYLEGDPETAIKQFNGYLSSFPKGIHSLQSHFYLAQLYFKKGLLENAAPHYKFVTDATQSEFTEEALLRLSQYYLEQKSWKEALPVLKRLEAEANFPQNTVFAQSNLMKAYYQLKVYNDAVIYANKVLESPKIDNKIKSDAQIIIARSAIKTGDNAKAKSAYKLVEKIATGITAAEALYYDAYFKHEEGAFEASNAAAQRLAKEYSSYKFYSAKGLVVMAKNFYGLDDAYQATYILESVIANFKQYPEVTAEAAQELAQIKRNEAKTNASVTTE
jgi:TolA-binding protein